MSSDSTPTLSICIPVFNEAQNLGPLYEAILAVIDRNQIAAEIIFVDDGSTDDSWDQIRKIAALDPRVRGLKFAANCGETAASDAAWRAARGMYVLTMDADLQNDPADIPKFLEALSGGVDCVCGTRVASRGQGDNFIRVVSSRVANWVRNKLSDENISDAGCTYRAFKRSCVPQLKLYRGLHRFIPTLLKMEGFRVMEIPVTHHPRLHGQSKYGVWNRLFKSSGDLLAIRWMKSRRLGYRIEEELGRGGSVTQSSGAAAMSGGEISSTNQPNPRRRRRRRMALLAALLVVVIVGLGLRKTPEAPAEGDSLNAVAASMTPASTEPATLRVATFNIAGGTGQIDLKRNLPRTAAVVRDFDLVGLNEVHGGILSDSRDQAQILGEILNKPWLYAPTERQWWRDAFGNAIICDLPVIHWQRFPLSEEHAESNRNVLLAKVMFHGKVVNVIITHLDRHLDHDPELESVIELFLGTQEPAILMGDLNSYPSHPLIQKLLKNPTVADAVCAKSDQNLDWIFVRGLKRLDGGTVDRGASDHPMFWAELGDSDK